MQELINPPGKSKELEQGKDLRMNIPGGVRGNIDNCYWLGLVKINNGSGNAFFTC